ncbi:ABC transporter substrate-binding protein [Bacillus sp. B-jedd]|uniref:ABC transporter substrate-binding protein n=1 Tax=Bacillus sp. B-jedd TaxID=1476857 RepID=UPI00051556B3|nr:ABC transporter substrate-binding protein [Bacillus sp. B-jedd]CEG29256.1 ABC transporter substrate-binding protein [Bacillus sp. B-jedd]
MKTKWYLFFLTIATISMLVYSAAGSVVEAKTKIGVLMVGDSRHEKLTGLKKGLKDLGYEDGEFIFIVKNAGDQPAKLNGQIDALLASSPDIIVSMGGVETIRLKELGEKKGLQVPVVFAGVAAPQELGLIKDYKHPGGKFTGISNYHTSITGKRLELLKDLVPSIGRVHVIYDTAISASKISLKETETAAEKLSLTIVPWDIRTPGFEGKLTAEARPGDALFILPSFKIESMTADLARLAHENRLPSMGIYKNDVSGGFLASYGAGYYEQGYQAARYISLLVKGNSPGDLPVELSDNLQFVISKNEADFLKLELNPDLMSIADYDGAKERGGSGGQ